MRTAEYRRFQERRRKNRLKCLMEDCPSVVWWNDYQNKRYLKIYYYGNRFYKNQARRKIRRLSNDDKLPKGNISNKYYEYWWSIT